MYMVKDTYISLDGIRKLHYEASDFTDYLVITYAYDEEHPTRISIKDRDEYFDIAHEISCVIREINK